MVLKSEILNDFDSIQVKHMLMWEDAFRLYPDIPHYHAGSVPELKLLLLVKNNQKPLDLQRKRVKTFLSGVARYFEKEMKAKNEIQAWFPVTNLHYMGLECGQEGRFYLYNSQLPDPIVEEVNFVSSINFIELIGMALDLYLESAHYLTCKVCDNPLAPGCSWSTEHITDEFISALERELCRTCYATIPGQEIEDEANLLSSLTASIKKDGIKGSNVVSASFNGVPIEGIPSVSVKGTPVPNVTGLPKSAHSFKLNVDLNVPISSMPTSYFSNRKERKQDGV